MMFKVGDRVIDHLGRVVQLEERARMGRFKVWLAAPLKQGKPDAEHCIILKDEETALHHLSLVVQMQLGQFVTYKKHDGKLANGVFCGIDEHGRPKVAGYDPEDGCAFMAAVPAPAIVFEN